MKKFLAILLVLFAWCGIALAAVDVNTAGDAELQKIKGIGSVKAKAILDERKKNGPFKSLEDVAARVKGIGDKTIADWKKSGEVVAGPAAPAAAKDAGKDSKAPPLPPKK